MRTLYRVMMKRLWQDKFMRILAVLALLWGVYTGLETGAARKYQYLYVDDFYFNMAMVFFSAMLCFSLGRMYRDGTVRNALIAGYTRVQHYAAAMLTAVTAAVIWFLLTVLPMMLMMLPEYHRLNEKAVIEAFAMIFFCDLFGGIAAALCCELRRSQLGGVIMCFAVVFGLMFLLECTNQAVNGQEWYEESLTDVDGMPIFDENGNWVRVKRHNFWYDEPLHSVMMTLHRANPLTGISDLSLVFQDSRDWNAEEQTKYRAELDTMALDTMEKSFPVMIPVMILVPLCGGLLFRRRDIR